MDVGAVFVLGSNEIQSKISFHPDKPPRPLQPNNLHQPLLIPSRRDYITNLSNFIIHPISFLRKDQPQRLRVFLIISSDHSKNTDPEHIIIINFAY